MSVSMRIAEMKRGQSYGNHGGRIRHKFKPLACYIILDAAAHLLFGLAANRKPETTVHEVLRKLSYL